MTRPNPRVVIQAHNLRSTATRNALLHGPHRARTERGLTGLLWASAVLAIVAVGVVVLAARIADLLQHSGR